MLGLPDAAEHFQNAGITTLIYDPRSTGTSDGQPRNDIDPFKQVEDLSDALTFLGALPNVDRNQMGLGGMSFGAVLSLCAASLDKRARFAVAICPLTDFEFSSDKRPKILAKCMKDRESQIMGNPPFYLPMVTEKGENPAGFGSGIDKARYALIVEIGKQIAPNHVNRTTIQTYYRLLMWQPFSLWQHLSSTPVMFIVPEMDSISPREAQLHLFDSLAGPKSLHVEQGVGHEDILTGDHLTSLITLQAGFINDALAGKIV